SILAVTGWPISGLAAPFHHMRDLALGGIDIHDAGDRRFAAAGRDENAAVGRLSARHGIEHGAVEHHALIGHLLDGRAAVLEVGVVAEQTIGGHGACPCDYGFWKGITTPDLRSSQGGTGSPFWRRKSGSKSFDW